MEAHEPSFYFTKDSVPHALCDEILSYFAPPFTSGIGPLLFPEVLKTVQLYRLKKLNFIGIYLVWEFEQEYPSDGYLYGLVSKQSKRILTVPYQYFVVRYMHVMYCRPA